MRHFYVYILLCDISICNISLSDIKQFRDFYLIDVTWQDNIKLLVTWMNRSQNKSVTVVCYAFGADCYVVSKVNLVIVYL